jgi:hypothetical protein
VTAETALYEESILLTSLGVVLGLIIAVAGAGFSAFGFAEVIATISDGYRNTFLGHAGHFTLQQRLIYIAQGSAYMVIVGGLGIWRFKSGAQDGEPHFAFQGVILSTLGAFLGLTLVLPHIWGAFFRPPSGPHQHLIRGGSTPKKNTEDLTFSSPGQFAFFALTGLILSFGVIEYVQTKRAQSGLIPLTMGEFVEGRVNESGFEGYPSEADLQLPPELEGTFSLIYVEVNPCQMKLLDDNDEPVKVLPIPKNVDGAGDTLSYARWQFDAAPERQYRLKMMRPKKSCRYSVRLVRGGQ